MPLSNDNTVFIPGLSAEDLNVENVLNNAKKYQEYKEKDGKSTDDNYTDCDSVENESVYTQEELDSALDEECEKEQEEYDYSNLPSEPEMNDQAKCIQEGLDAITDLSKELSELEEKYADYKKIIGEIDEFLENLRVFYNYNNVKYNTSDTIVPKVSEPTARETEKVTIRSVNIPAFIVSLKLYTHAVGVDINDDCLLCPKIHFKTDDINDSEYLTDDDKKLFESIDHCLEIKNEFDSDIDAKGEMYKKWFNLMSQTPKGDSSATAPQDNFFTIEERGLTKNSSDAYTIKGTESIKGLENLTAGSNIEVNVNGKTYYASNKLYDRYTNFYENVFINEIDDRFKEKGEEVRNRAVYKALDAEGKVIGGMEGALYSKSGKGHKLAKKFIERYKAVRELKDRLNEECEKIKNDLSETSIKNKIQNKISNTSKECQGLFKIDETETPLDNTNMKDPIDTPSGRNPKYPTYQKYCYWTEFCKLATKFNIWAPILDTNNLKSFRYWSVGFVWQSIKIPLPTIWIPVFVIDTAAGCFVILLTMNGIFPAIHLMYIGMNGIIRFLTSVSVSSVKSGKMLEGSDNFGFSEDDRRELESKFGEKSYKVPIVNPAEIANMIQLFGEKILDIENLPYDILNADSVVADGIDSFSSAIQNDKNVKDFIRRYKANLSNQNEGIDIYSEINSWKNALIESIYNVPEHSISTDMLKTKFIEYIKNTDISKNVEALSNAEYYDELRTYYKGDYVLYKKVNDYTDRDLSGRKRRLTTKSNNDDKYVYIALYDGITGDFDPSKWKKICNTKGINEIVQDILDKAPKFSELEDFIIKEIDEIKETRKTKFKFPKNFDATVGNTTLTPITNLFDIVKNLPYDDVLGLSLSTMNIKDFVLNMIYRRMEDEEFKEKLKKYPEKIIITFNDSEKIEKAKKKYKDKKDKIDEEIDSSNESLDKVNGDINDFIDAIKDITDYVISKVNLDIWDDSSIAKALAVLNSANAYNPYKCYTDDEIKVNIVNPITAIWTVAILEIINQLSYSNLKIMFGGLSDPNYPNSIVIKREQILSSILLLIKKYCPEIELIDPVDSFRGLRSTIIDIYRDSVDQLSKISFNLSEGEIKELIKNTLKQELLKYVSLPIEVDLKELLKQAVHLIFEQFNDVVLELIFPRFEMMLLKDEMGKPFYLTDSIIKNMICDLIEESFNTGSDIIAPYIEAYNTYVSIKNKIKALKNSGILDVNAISIIGEGFTGLGKRIGAGFMNGIAYEEFLDSINFSGGWTVDQEMITAAYAMIEEFKPLNDYHLIVMLCSIYGDKAKDFIRALYPLMYSDDIPPYERLKLSNPLFCIFLDGMHVEAKKLSGYQENYI